MTNSKTDTSKIKEKDLQGAFVVKDEKVSFREVKIGIAGDRFFEVLSGLEPEEEVVIGPFSALRRLRESDRVSITKRDKPADEKE